MAASKYIQQFAHSPRRQESEERRCTGSDANVSLGAQFRASSNARTVDSDAKITAECEDAISKFEGPREISSAENIARNCSILFFLFFAGFSIELYNSIARDKNVSKNVICPQLLVIERSFLNIKG